MTALSVRGLHKSFGASKALQDLTFDVDSGTTAALLGPSGCGKTTLLRIVAGFERPDAGEVLVGDEMVTGPHHWTRPERRSIGYVAQEGALFPHLTVGGNIGFALTRAERRAGSRVLELLELVSLDRGHLTRFPHELSGGQQQRVALARALARRPNLMLLDEPFAALDASLRSDTRELMAAALAAEKVTTVLVTHDQEEALSFADLVVLIRNGRVQQAGSPRELYRQPADAWTAGFVGDVVLLPGVVTDGVAATALGRVELSGAVRDGSATILLRPEQIRLRPVAPAGSPVGGTGLAQVMSLSYRGHDTVASVRLIDGPELAIRCRIPGDTPWIGIGIEVLVESTGRGIVLG